MMNSTSIYTCKGNMASGVDNLQISSLRDGLREMHKKVSHKSFRNKVWGKGSDTSIFRISHSEIKYWIKRATLKYFV
jgi:hypothetical protein